MGHDVRLQSQFGDTYKVYNNAVWMCYVCLVNLQITFVSFKCRMQIKCRQYLQVYCVLHSACSGVHVRLKNPQKPHQTITDYPPPPTTHTNFKRGKLIGKKFTWREKVFQSCRWPGKSELLLFLQRVPSVIIAFFSGVPTQINPERQGSVVYTQRNLIGLLCLSGF